MILRPFRSKQEARSGGEYLFHIFIVLIIWDFQRIEAEELPSIPRSLSLGHTNQGKDAIDLEYVSLWQPRGRSWSSPQDESYQKEYREEGKRIPQSSQAPPIYLHQPASSVWVYQSPSAFPTSTSERSCNPRGAKEKCSSSCKLWSDLSKATTAHDDGRSPCRSFSSHSSRKEEKNQSGETTTTIWSRWFDEYNNDDDSFTFWRRTWAKLSKHVFKFETALFSATSRVHQSSQSYACESTHDGSATNIWISTTTAGPPPVSPTSLQTN